jgi:hypothetical protein
LSHDGNTSAAAAIAIRLEVEDDDSQRRPCGERQVMVV